MRIFFVFAWIVLIMTVTTLSKERSKRDLSFLKKIIESLLGTKRKLQSKEHARFYKTPGRENDLLKVAPKQSIRETESVVRNNIFLEPVDLTLSYIRSYLGTKTSKETIDAINQVKNLVNLRILSEKENEEIQNFIVPLKPAYIKYAIKEKNEIYSINSPVRATVENPKHVTPFEIINYGPIIGRESVTIEEIPKKPSRVRVSEIFKPKYSYKQTDQDGSIRTFKSEGDQNIIVTETEVIPPLPSYIKFRLGDVAAKCITRINCTQPILDNTSSLKYETIEIRKPNSIVSSTSKITDNINKMDPLLVEDVENFNVIPEVVKQVKKSPAFGKFKKSGHFVRGDFDEPIMIKENPVLKETSVTMLSKEGSKGVSVNTERNSDIKLFRENNQTKTNLSHITANKDGNSEPNHNHDINNKHVDSQFSYKQIEHNVPGREDKFDTKSVDLKKDKILILEDTNTIPINDLYVPPLVENASLEKLNKTIKDDTDVPNNPNLSNSFQKIKPDKTMPNISEESKAEYSFKDNPIIVADDIPYVYKQMKRDGSLITTRGNFKNVSIESKTNEDDENVSGIIF